MDTTLEFSSKDPLWILSTAAFIAALCNHSFFTNQDSSLISLLANMFIKPLAIFATVLGVVGATTPTGSPTYEPTSWSPLEDCPTPLDLQCDTDPFNLIPQKTTLELEDYGVTVVASLTCEKALSRAQACVFPEGEGVFGIVVADSYGSPFCWTDHYLEYGVKQYRSSCRGKDFKIKYDFKIKWPKDRLLRGNEEEE